MAFSLTQEQIDAVEHVLAVETTAAAVADRLFSPSGLFVQWAGAEEERRAVTKTDIFRKAQARFRELQSQEGARFSQAVAGVRKKGKPELFKWDGLTPLQGKG